VVLCFAIALLQTKSISVDIPALPVTKAIAEISRLCGDTFYASPELAVDIVCIRAKDVAVSDLREQIAKTIGAEWQQREGKLVLARSSGLERAQEAEELSAKAKEIAKLISAKSDLPKYTEADVIAMVSQAGLLVEKLHLEYSDENSTKAFRELMGLLDRGPTSRMLKTIIQSLDPMELARIGPSQQVIFSNKPTRMQKPLKASVVAQVKANFAAEQTLLRRIIERGPAPVYEKSGDNRYFSWESEPTFSKILLRVQTAEGTDLPRFTLKLANEKGDVRSWSSLTLNRTLNRSAKSRTWEGEFALSPEAVQWKQLFFVMVGVGEIDGDTKKPVQQVIEPWIDRHSNPDQFEPLSFAAGEAFVRFADSQHKNLVACIPDQALVWYEKTDKLSAQAFADHAVSKWSGVFEDDGSWLRFRPHYLSEGRRNRIDRGALKQFFRSAFLNGSIRIGDAAQYAYAVTSPLLFSSWDQTAAGYTERLQGEYSTSEFAIWYHRGSLKLLGALSEEQRQTVLNGGSVPASQLSSKAKEMLTKFTFGEHLTNRGLFGRLILHREYDPQAVLGNIREEATEALPNGIPAGTEIRGTAEKVPMILERVVADFTYSTTYSPESFGDVLARNESFDNSYKSELYLGSTKKVTLNVNYGPGLETKDELPEVVRQRRAKYSSWKELPEALKSGIEKGYKAAKESLAKRRTGSQSTAPPPLRN
jgi:hypothetical protein